ncbi:MmcQ/YjbR family DNA-binding protein [Microbacterium sp. NPDC056569]|uniref:MmcQ/YjbR family DNA-binding protein n=1 Tax=Microbacterium sp. NPDC056569 TaxID=3345867 RepID=UPI00367278BF
MATLDDVRAIALELPGAIESIDGHRGGASWRTPAGAFVWQRGPSARDLEQLAALGRAWPPGDVVGVRTDGTQVKEALLETYPGAFFTIPHFDGYPAVLVRLDSIELDQLREVVTDAWLLKVSKRVANEWLAAHPPATG